MRKDPSLSNLINRYGATVHQTIDQLLARELENIETGAALIAEAIRAGGLLTIVGTGHSHMLAEEIFYRAGGLVAVNPILEPALMLHEGALKSTKLERLQGVASAVIEDSGLTSRDVFVVASNSGRNAVPVEMALIGKKIGCPVVAITSLKHSAQVSSRDASGKRLYEVADLVIDNTVPYGDASIEIPGIAARMGPLSTLAGVFIVNALAMRTAEILVAEGEPPQVFVSANVNEDGALDSESLLRLRQRVKAL